MASAQCHDCNFCIKRYGACYCGESDWDDWTEHNENNDECVKPVKDLDITPKTFTVQDPSNIRYNLGFNSDSCIEDIVYDSYDNTPNWYKDNKTNKWLLSIFKSLSDHSLKDIQLDFGNISIVNPCGFNDDHRGSDHTRIILDHTDTSHVTNGCTLYDLANACYRLKSHKFDNNYELFNESTIVTSKHSNEYTITLSFDHGS